MASINVGKTQSNNTIQESEHNKKCQAMETAITNFFRGLGKSSDIFNPEEAFDELLKYATSYDRILYSTISNYIYAQYDCKGNFDTLGTVLSNLEALVEYAENSSNIATKKSSLPKNTKVSAVDDTRKMVLKIWDHVALASHQYTMLKQTDDEYDEKFKTRISSYKEEMSKEMNTQMITMVGIFTALAFLIFGSISSLDGVFENIDFPIFKVMSIGLIWGISVSNMIFVFLYCIGKMTKLSFKSDDNPNANIFQRYPVVWWTNLTLVSLLLFSLWGWFVQQSAIGNWLVSLSICSPLWVFIIGSVAIIAITVVLILLLSKAMKRTNK